MSILVLQRFDLAARIAVIKCAGGAQCGATADALASTWVILHIDQATGKLLLRAPNVITRTPMGRYDRADQKRDLYRG